MELLGVLAMGFLVVFLLWKSSREKSHHQALKAFAAARGWSLQGGSVYASVDGAAVSVQQAVGTTSAVRIGVDTGHSLPGVHIGRIDRAGRDHGDVASGDPRLDRLRLQGPAAVLLAVLTPRSRAAVCDAVGRGWRFDEGTWSIRLTRVSAHTLEDCVGFGLSLQHDLALDGELHLQLDRRQREETSDLVARELLRARLGLPEPLAEAVKEHVLARRDHANLLLARRQGLEGVPHLFDLAAHAESRDVRWEAIQYLSAHRGDARIGAALAEFVSDGALGTAALEQIRFGGTVAEVPALRAVADRGGERGELAEQAIAAIQARGRGQVGQLSVVEAPDGAGAVSVVKRPSEPEG